jgi:hypothetical protein
MSERDEKRDYFIIRGKADADDYDDIVAAVAVKNGVGGIAADARLTVPMLSLLCRRHGLRHQVIGGAFALDSETFIRGAGGIALEGIREMLGAEPSAEVVLYTYGLLVALAAQLTSDDRWELI